jgi:hypothetical protein
MGRFPARVGAGGGQSKVRGSRALIVVEGQRAIQRPNKPRFVRKNLTQRGQGLKKWVIAVGSKVLLENIGPSEIRCHLARLVRYRQVTLMVI